ncbi:MAG: PIG-L family deacetylase [Chloroflexi bacterium]|nr:PIG-L family deacetylase [Chloroflexota bacterium]
MQPDGGVLFVHAHPDDESMGTGGTMARLVSEGVRVDLVTCTDGAEGEIHDPTLDADEARPRLAQIRAQELACSVAALGSGGIHQHLLGYRDSGMIGTDANAHPDCFWQADAVAATGRLLEIVREVRPSVIVSYDENGNYGHPDHINAARIARDAYLASAGEPWAVSRFYEMAFVRERWFDLMGAMKERGISLPWDLDDRVPGPAADELNPSNAAAMAQVGEAIEAGESDAIEFGRADADVTTRVDVSGFLDAKRRSMACHKTQAQDLGWLLDLPHDLADRAIDSEYFVLRWLDGQDVAPPLRETSLFGD